LPTARKPLRVGYPAPVMRRALLGSALTTALALAPGDAAAKGKHRHHDGPKPTWGGWGHATVGVMAGDFGSVGDRLDDGDALDDEINPRPFAAMLGGGGKALLAGRYIVGGKGFAFVPPSQVTSQGRMTMVGGGGGLDVGLVLFNRRNWLIYPYAGVGGFGYTLDIHNQGERDVVVSPNITLDPEQEVKLTSGFATLELGFGFARSMFWGDPRKGGAGGMVHNVEVGMMMALSQERWRTEDDVSVAIPPANLLGAYVRLNIGGGGFLYKK